MNPSGRIAIKAASSCMFRARIIKEEGRGGMVLYICNLLFYLLS
jgi:hypothetical protein